TARRGEAPGPASAAPRKPWDSRVAELQSARVWHLRGRAAVAVGEQGWQANLDWRQDGEDADVELSGPLGAGAVALRVTPGGVTVKSPVRGADAGGDDPGAVIRERMGFEPPFGLLRYWLLGVPASDQAANVERGPGDRPSAIAQAQWHVSYSRYGAVDGDV